MKQARLGFLILLVTLFLGATIFPTIPSCNESIFQSTITPIGSHSVAHSNLFILTFTSEWNSTPTVVNTGARLIGDRIILNATWIDLLEVNHTQIVVNATAVPLWITAQRDHTSVEINTRGLGANHTCTITMSAWLVNGSIINRTRENVFIGSFFTPHIELLSPLGGETWVGENNVTWVAWDNNSVETLSFEVLLSSDGGKSFMLLASNIEENWYPWNCSMFLISDTYLIEVRVTDGIYTEFDRSATTFTAGCIVPTPTTTPITTTHTPTPTPTPSTSILTTTSTTETTSSVATSTVTTITSTTTPAPVPQTNYVLAIILSSAIIASAFLAVFVYYLASRKL